MALRPGLQRGAGPYRRASGVGQGGPQRGCRHHRKRRHARAGRYAPGTASGRRDVTERSTRTRDAIGPARRPGAARRWRHGKWVGYGFTAFDVWSTGSHLYYTWGTDEFEGAMAEDGTPRGGRCWSIPCSARSLCSSGRQTFIEGISQLTEVVPSTGRDLAAAASAVANATQRMTVGIFLRPGRRLLRVAAPRQLGPPHAGAARRRDPAPRCQLVDDRRNSQSRRIPRADRQAARRTRPAARPIVEFNRQLAAAVQLLEMPPTEKVALLQKLLRFIEDPEFVADEAVHPEGHQADKKQINYKVCRACGAALQPQPCQLGPG